MHLFRTQTIVTTVGRCICAASLFSATNAYFYAHCLWKKKHCFVHLYAKKCWCAIQRKHCRAVTAFSTCAINTIVSNLLRVLFRLFQKLSIPYRHIRPNQCSFLPCMFVNTRDHHTTFERSSNQRLLEYIFSMAKLMHNVQISYNW